MAVTSYDAAVHAIGRARGLLSGARRMSRKTKSGPHGETVVIISPRLPTTTLADMRRFSVVMAVAALDTYMHRLVVERAFNREKLPAGWPSSTSASRCSWTKPMPPTRRRARSQPIHDLASL